MKAWNPGDRVVHDVFGAGTVLQYDEQHAVIHFDDQGRRTLSTRHAVLAAANEPPRPVGPLPSLPRGPRTVAERNTTDIGYENVNRQKVVRATMLEGNLPGQRVYVLKCGKCDHQYGANGCDIHIRRCPMCDGGQPGLVF